MTDFDNTNRGVLFYNTKKKHPKAPDYSGTVNVGGEEYTLSAWTKTSQKGNEFLSLKIETETWKGNAAQPQRRTTRPDPEDTDIPFKPNYV